jgi:hypothetical protein
MKYLIIGILVIFSWALKGQSLPGIATYGAVTKSDVRKEINKAIKKSLKTTGEAFLREAPNGDTLVYHNKNNAESFTVTYTFNLPPVEGGEETYCDKQEFVFDCALCFDVHLKDILSSCGFRKLSETTYLSRYAWKTELEVIRKETSFLLMFRYVDKPAREYKARYKALTKE